MGTSTSTLAIRAKLLNLITSPQRLLLLLVSLLLAGYLLMSGNAWGSSSDQGADEIYPQFYLKPAFAVKEAKLAVCAKTPMALPIESHERLFLIFGGKHNEVTDLKVLRWACHY